MDQPVQLPRHWEKVDWKVRVLVMGVTEGGKVRGVN